MKLVAPVLVVAVCSALFSPQTLRAQETKLAPRQFLLDEYRTVFHGNFKLMRETGVWDELGGSALKVVVAMIEKEFSFELDDLDYITSVQAPIVEEGIDIATQRSLRQITTLVGTGDLGAADAKGDDRRYQVEKIGDYRLLLDAWSSDAVIDVTPKLRVHGPTEMLRSVLKGKPRTGLPSADVLSFTAGKKNLLAYIVGDVKNHRQPRESLGMMLPDAAWPEDDEPTHMCIRLLATGDEDDPHLTLEWALRHGKDGAGLVATEKAVASALARLKEVKEMRILRPLLKKVEKQRDGTDAVWRVDLGRARQALGTLGTLAPFMMFASIEEAQVMAPQQVQVEVVEEAAPKPKKKAPKAKKSEQKRIPVTTGGGN